MRVIFNLLIVFAALLSILILVIVVIRISDGGFSILFPGLGLVISFGAIVVPLLIIDALIIAAAFLIRKSGFKKLD